MGFNLDSWNEFAGALFMGAGTSMTGIWTLVSVVCCVIALVVGSKHELDAYRREQEKSGN